VLIIIIYQEVEIIKYVQPAQQEEKYVKEEKILFVNQIIFIQLNLIPVLYVQQVLLVQLLK